MTSYSSASDQHRVYFSVCLSLHLKTPWRLRLSLLTPIMVFSTTAPCTRCAEPMQHCRYPCNTTSNAASCKHENFSEPQRKSGLKSSNIKMHHTDISKAGGRPYVGLLQLFPVFELSPEHWYLILLSLTRTWAALLFSTGKYAASAGKRCGHAGEQGRHDTVNKTSLRQMWERLPGLLGRKKRCFVFHHSCSVCLVDLFLFHTKTKEGIDISAWPQRGQDSILRKNWIKTK